MLPPSPRKRRATKLGWAIPALCVLACDGAADVPAVAGVMDRETFIQVYLDLRIEGVRSVEMTLPPEARDRILADHGVDEQGLMAFIDAYGGELEYMNELWAEIERRYEAIPPEPRAGNESGA